MKKIIHILFCLAVAGCCGNQPTDRKGKVENIQRVFMHEPGDYTVMWLDKDKQLQTRRFNGYRSNVILKADVSSGEPMWAEWRGWGSPNHPNEDRYVSYERVVIHVHNAESINGAGWNHGKHGRGQTQEVAR